MYFSTPVWVSVKNIIHEGNNKSQKTFILLSDNRTRAEGISALDESKGWTCVGVGCLLVICCVCTHTLVQFFTRCCCCYSQLRLLINSKKMLLLNEEKAFKQRKAQRVDESFIHSHTARAIPLLYNSKKWAEIKNLSIVILLSKIRMIIF